MTVKITAPSINLRAKLQELDHPNHEKLIVSKEGDLTVIGGMTATDGITVGDGHTLRNDGFDNLLIESSAGESIVLNSNSFPTIVKSDDGFRVQTVFGTERMRVDGSGLAIKITGTAASAFITTDTNRDSNVYFGDTSSATQGRVQYSNITDSMALWTNSAERMRITSAGDVGIGLTNPAAKLEVTGSDNRALKVTRTKASPSNDTYAFEVDNSAHNSNVSAAGAMKITVNSGVAMAINGFGNVGIGTSNPQNLMHLFTGSNGSGLTIQRNSVIAGDYAQLSFSNSTDVGNTPSAYIRGVRGVVSGQDYLTFSTSMQERMRIDSAGRVGIGTSVPAAGLHVHGNSGVIISDPTSAGTSSSPNYLNLEFRGYNSTARGRISGIDRAGSLLSGGLTFWTGASGAMSRQMTIESDGKVGIGTSVPLGTLHTKDDTSGISAIIENTANNTRFQIKASGTNKNSELWFGDAGQDNAGAVDYDHNDNSMKFFTDVVERVRITNTGDVGIGTATPLGRLHIQGAGSNIEDGQGLYITENGSQGAYFKYDGDGNDGVLGGYTDGENEVLRWDRGGSSLIFKTGNTERMRLDSAGNLMLGRTTPYDGSLGTHVGGDGFIGLSRAGSGCLLLNRGTSNGDIATFRRDNQGVGSITVTASATAYNTSSDYRLKEDWRSIDAASAKVMALNPVNVAWKVDGSRSDTFIAHELAEVLPYAVTGEKDGEEMQSVDYSKVVPLLTAALQEALARIEALEAEAA